MPIGLQKILKGSIIMNREQANKAIACTITNCKNHCCNEDYCSLQKIQVGSHETNPTEKACTDCVSFEMK